MKIDWNKYRIPISRKIESYLQPDYISELIGTFYLVFTVCVNVLQNKTLAPLSIGAILMAFIFATGGISGAHFNPAVSLAIHLVYPEKFSLQKMMKYMVTQCTGAMLAGLLTWWIMDDTFTLSPGGNRTAFDVICVEAFFATALCLVVLNVATTKQDENNSYFGLAIGFTVVASAFGIGPVSGCAINPAVSFGTMVVHFFHTGKGLAYLVVYFGTPLIGAFASSILFRLIRRADFESSDSTVYNDAVSEGDNKPIITN